MKRTQWIVILLITHLFANVPLIGMYHLLIFRFRDEGTGGNLSAVLINAGLFAVFGLSHSILAREAIKRPLAALVGESYVRTVYVLVAGITLSIMLIGWQPLSGTIWQATGALYGVLVLGMLASFAGMAYAIWTTDYPDFLGLRAHQRRLRGYPIRPAQFTTKGLYGHCRHPFYTLVLLSFWITPVMSATRLEFVLLGSLYMVVGVHFEEQNLRQEFGEIYDRYRAHVPRWIPRWRPWRDDDLAAQEV